MSTYHYDEENNLFSFWQGFILSQRLVQKNGFKFDRSSRKWTVENLLIDNAEEFASYCRKYGLTFERSDRMITEFDYADYLWDGRRDEFMKPSENIEIPQPKNKI